MGDRKDRAELEANQERVGSSVATIGVKSDVGMHTADTGPARRDDRVCHSSSSGKDDFNVLLDQVDRLTDTAAQMLADEKKLGLNGGPFGGPCGGRARQERNTFSPSADAARAGRGVKMACLAPSVALR